LKRSSKDKHKVAHGKMQNLLQKKKNDCKKYLTIQQYLDDWGDATDECFALLLVSEKDLLKITNVSGPEK
jgi:hypothetical protein